MKLILATAVLLLGVANVPSRDWTRWAEICGNIMTDQQGIEKASYTLYRRGCRDVYAVPVINDDSGNVYLVYGVKIRGAEYLTESPAKILPRPE